MVIQDVTPPKPTPDFEDRPAPAIEPEEAEDGSSS